MLLHIPWACDTGAVLRDGEKFAPGVVAGVLPTAATFGFVGGPLFL